MTTLAQSSIRAGLGEVFSMSAEMKYSLPWLHICSGFLLLILSRGACATEPEGTMVLRYSTFGQVALSTVDIANYTTIAIEGNKAVNDGGGGLFVYDTNTEADYKPCPLDGSGNAQSDGGTSVVDSVHSCFRRVFSGPVHLPWYGVKDAATSDCYTNNFASCDSTTAIGNAFTASGHLGDGGVTTDGRSIAVLSGNINIPEKQYLTCSGPPGGFRVQTSNLSGYSNYYYELPNSIVLNPSDKILTTANRA